MNVIIEFSKSILLLDNTTTTTITLIDYEINTDFKIFWAIVTLKEFTERIPIWVDSVFDQNINNWDLDLLVKSVKAYYDNDRGVVSVVYKDTSGQDWDSFNIQMMSSPRFNQVYNTCLAQVPIVASALPVAIDQITTKGYSLFALVWAQVCNIGGATPQDRLVWAELAENNNLPQEFIDLLAHE